MVKILRVNERTWAFEGIEDEPLNLLELSAVLQRVCRVSVDQIMTMLTEIDATGYSMAVFSQDSGTFLYCE